MPWLSDLSCKHFKYVYWNLFHTVDGGLIISSSTCCLVVLQLMMTRLESKLAQTHVALTGPTRQQVLQLMMTRYHLTPLKIGGERTHHNNLKWMDLDAHKLSQLENALGSSFVLVKFTAAGLTEILKHLWNFPCGSLKGFWEAILLGTNLVAEIILCDVFCAVLNGNASSKESYVMFFSLKFVELNYT